MLTRLLGKLNIDQLVRDPNRDAPPGFFSSPVPVNYGLGLKECKDFTENYLGRISCIKAVSKGVNMYKSYTIVRNGQMVATANSLAEVREKLNNIATNAENSQKSNVERINADNVKIDNDLYCITPSSSDSK